MTLGIYLHEARRYLLLAVVPALIFAALAYLYTHREPKVYQATATLYVQQQVNAAQGGVPGGTDIQGSATLAPTYSNMITDPVVAQKVDQEMAARYPGYRVENHNLTSVQKPGVSTLLVTVSAEDTLPARAAAAVNTVADVFIKRIQDLSSARFQTDAKSLRKQIDATSKNIQSVTQQINSYHGSDSGLTSLKNTLNAFQTTYQQLQTSYAQFKVQMDAAENNVSLYSPAAPPTSPIGPHPFREAILVGFVVLLLCIGGIYLRDYLDDSLRRPEEIEEIAGAPVLGTVNRFDIDRMGALVAETSPRSTVAETYRLIRTNIQFASIDHAPRTILVTSPGPGEGKSTTVSNLALVFAQGGTRVTLLDADLRKPNQHRLFQLNRMEGLTSLLTRGRLNGHGISPTNLSNLAVIASGPLPPNPADLLGSQRMHGLVDHLREQTAPGVVFIDSPPILPVTDAAVLSTMVDGVILVVDLDKTKRRDLQRARDSIEAVGGKFLGVVVNRLTPHGAGYYYYRYGYLYHDEYGSQDASASLPPTSTTGATTDPSTTQATSGGQA